MEDDSGYVYDEDSTTEQSSGGSGPFLTAVGILVVIFVLAAACSIFLFLNRGGDSSAEAAQATSIAATNEAILAQNAQVTETIAAMETEAARPTETPTPPPPTFTPEPSPTNTSEPTNTPVVVDIEDGTEVAEGEEGEVTDGTPNVSGTSVFDNETEESTPTPIPVAGGSDEDALPDTGFELWAIALAGVVLVGILVAARRMRGA
jgi:flagellar basal body-associated protein FliL